MNKLVAFALLLMVSSGAQSSPAHGEHGMRGGGDAAAPVFSREEALARSRSALGGRIGNHEFHDQSGRPVLLHDLLGKPLLVNLIYTSCFHICPTTTRQLHRVAEQSRSLLGGDTFNVVTIGFDTLRDTPEMMAHFAVTQGVASDGWWFLSGTTESVGALTAELGFTFQPSPTGFDHLIQTTVVTPTGEVFRHIYGMDFAPPLVIEPLKHLIYGDEESSLAELVTDRIRLFCTVYDPARGRYRFDYSIFVGTFIAFLCVGLLGWQLLREWRVHLRAARERSGKSGGG